MYTIQNDTVCFVGTGSGELCFTNSGTWVIGAVTYVAGGTNASVDLSAVRDGAYIVVDQDGTVFLQDGPAGILAVSMGIAVAAFTVGMTLGLRFIFRALFKAGGIPLSGIE